MFFSLTYQTTSKSSGNHIWIKTTPKPKPSDWSNGSYRFLWQTTVFCGLSLPFSAAVAYRWEPPAIPSVAAGLVAAAPRTARSSSPSPPPKGEQYPCSVWKSGELLCGMFGINNKHMGRRKGGLPANSTICLSFSFCSCLWIFESSLTETQTIGHKSCQCYYELQPHETTTKQSKTKINNKGTTVILSPTCPLPSMFLSHLSRGHNGAAKETTPQEGRSIVIPGVDGGSQVQIVVTSKRNDPRSTCM